MFDYVCLHVVVVAAVFAVVVVLAVAVAVVFGWSFC